MVKPKFRWFGLSNRAGWCIEIRRFPMRQRVHTPEGRYVTLTADDLARLHWKADIRAGRKVHEAHVTAGARIA